MTKFVLAFATLALAANAATTYKLTLFQPTVINGTELKPGDYKIELNGDKAVFNKQGKAVIEAPVTVQETTAKFPTNMVRYMEGQKVQEIRLGGTRTKLVFEGATSSESAAAAGR